MHVLVIVTAVGVVFPPAMRAIRTSGIPWRSPPMSPSVEIAETALDPIA